MQKSKKKKLIDDVQLYIISRLNDLDDTENEVFKKQEELYNYLKEKAGVDLLAELEDLWLEREEKKQIEAYILGWSDCLKTSLFRSVGQECRDDEVIGDLKELSKNRGGKNE